MSLSNSIFQESHLGVDTLLPNTGSSLENPYVYDSVARDLKVMAEEGLVDIRDEQVTYAFSPPLIERLMFKRLR